MLLLNLGWYQSDFRVFWQTCFLVRLTNMTDWSGMLLYVHESPKVGKHYLNTTLWHWQLQYNKPISYYNSNIYSLGNHLKKSHCWKKYYCHYRDSIQSWLWDRTGTCITPKMEIFFFSIRFWHFYWVRQFQTLASQANLNFIYSE